MSVVVRLSFVIGPSIRPASKKRVAVRPRMAEGESVPKKELYDDMIHRKMERTYILIPTGSLHQPVLPDKLDESHSSL